MNRSCCCDPHHTHKESILRGGFEIYERLFMELELATAELPPASKSTLPDGLELRAWRDSDFNAAGQLIAHAYEGHLDGVINDQ